MPSEPIGGHLVASLCYDWPEAVQSISGAALESWGVTLYEAMVVARSNLVEATLGYAKLGEGFYSFVSGDSYDATRIVLVDWIASLEVAGRHVAMTPNRDELMITGSEDESGLTMLADLAEKGLAEPYSLSASPLILEDGTWVDWLPPHGHPLRRRFYDLRMGWLGPLYTEQKGLLDAVHERQRVDEFVASLSAVEKEGGGMTTYCVWGKGPISLLPEAEKVVFMKEAEGIVALAEWHRVVEVVGDLMEVTDHYPARYRVRSFPDVAALAALGMAEM